MLERYQDNLKDKMIEFQGKTLYVIDQFNYENKIYVYTFNAEKFEKEDNLEINFFEKVEVDELKVVTDMKLFDKLMTTVGTRFVEREIRNLDLRKLS